MYQDNKKNPDENYVSILEKMYFQNFKIFKIFKNQNFEKTSENSKFGGNRKLQNNFEISDFPPNFEFSDFFSKF